MLSCLDHPNGVTQQSLGLSEATPQVRIRFLCTLKGVPQPVKRNPFRVVYVALATQGCFAPWALLFNPFGI